MRAYQLHCIKQCLSLTIKPDIYVTRSEVIAYSTLFSSFAHKACFCISILETYDK